MNCLESLMYYLLKMREMNADTVSTIMRLFQHHKKCSEELQVSISSIFFFFAL